MISSIAGFKMVSAKSVKALRIFFTGGIYITVIFELFNDVGNLLLEAFLMWK
jgi:hypothetical protein